MQRGWKSRLSKTKVEIQEPTAIFQERDKEYLEEGSGSEDKGMEINLKEIFKGHNLWDFVTDGI